jgi:hypothetical protein
MTSRCSARLGAVCGFVGVAGNVLGVAVLGHIPSAYRPGTMTSWTREVMAAPAAATMSAVAFTLGLLALAGWAWTLASRLGTPASRAAGAAIVAGALLNAAGTPAPLVVAHHLAPACGSGDECLAAGIAILGLSLSLDALFNLLLGAGLVGLSSALWRQGGSGRPLSVLGVAAGVLSIAVSPQVVSDAAPRLLAIAGPLWLAFVAWTSVRLWRET